MLLQTVKTQLNYYFETKTQIAPISDISVNIYLSVSKHFRSFLSPISNNLVSTKNTLEAEIEFLRVKTVR